MKLGVLISLKRTENVDYVLNSVHFYFSLCHLFIIRFLTEL